MSILDVIKRWVADQGDEAYQQKRREQEAKMREVIIGHERKRQESKDKQDDRAE